jgi:imidazoleglycerol-phosphate dehydratase/histidinol-phosphatase
VLEYLTAGDLDRCAGRVIGDRDSDMELAERMGIAGIHYGRGGMGWDEIAHALSARPRFAKVRRVTRETDIIVKLDLDASGDIEISTGIGFFDHMLEQLAKHGGFNLMLTCRGDLAIDEHHTVEDTALALGQALREALGNKRGLARYGFLLPMDEALAQVAVDLGGRAYCVFNASFQRERVGELPTELVPHFFQSLAQAAGATVHIQVGGDNAHHMIEAAFKATGRALRQALVREGEELPSTKGIL